MAYFGREEIVDSLQHGFAIDDDTGFSSKVLGKAIRRCKPGGLPLTFAAQSDSSDSDHSSPFEIGKSSIPSTSILCQQNISKKAKDVQNLIQGRRNQKPKVDQEQIDRYFVPHAITIKSPTNSLLSKQIEENKGDFSESRFNEFARFEAFENEPNSRLINIIFSFADHASNLPPPSLSVRAKNTASVEELIGLCCCLYTRSNFTPKCSDPWRYSLYMADDGYDFDTELPSIDRNRSVGECGFPMLALVENKQDKLSNPIKHVVTVYTVTNQKFVFELDSLNESLEWLRDEALKRRQEESKIQNNLNIRQTTYELEPIDSPQTLKLTNTISSTGLLEFLLIRKNSSRSNFNPSLFNDLLIESGPRAPLFVQTKQRPSDLRQIAPLSSSSSLKHLDNVDSPTTSIRSGLPSGNTQLGYGNLIQEYCVERVHRIKPRCSSKLVIRDDCLEITPIQVEKRRAFIPQAPQKYTTIAWDLIGGVDSERHGSKRSSRIWWLPLTSEIFELQESYQKYALKVQKRINESFYSDTPPQSTDISISHPVNVETDNSSPSPSKSARPSINEDQFGTNWANDCDPSRVLLKAYEGLSWKVIQIDALEDDAWQINMKIIEIIESKKSIVWQLFQNSSGGSKRPKTAAEATFFKGSLHSYFPNESKRTNRSSNSFANLKSNKRRSINPIPLLNRMLSKPE